MARLNISLNNKAFSLLEVIITVGILSAGIVFVLQALSFSARVTGLACDYSDAVFLAQNLIQELEFKERTALLSRPQEPKEATGSDGKLNWRYALGLDLDLKLYRMDLEIDWIRIDREEKLRLNTYLRE